MNRKSGGLIGKKVVITPTDGSADASASGIWTLQDVADYEAAGTFPQPDVPPIATEIAASVTMQATETQDLAVTFSGASDPDGDTVFDWTITESSGSLSLTPSSFTNVSSATTTFTAGEVSADTPITVTVTVTDQYGLSASKNFTFTIINDTSPVATGGTIAVTSLEEGAAYSVDCKNNFTDDNGDGNLTFSLASGTLPVGASLNTSTGVISDSAINVVSGNTGTVTYSYSITATDSPKGQTATQAYSSPVTKQPIDAVWSAYGSWGSCSETCGGGTQSRTRTCTEQLYGGTTCANTDGGNSSQSQACNTQSCWTALAASGGTVTTDGDYKVHTFTGTGTFTVTTLGTDGVVDFLVVGGGSSSTGNCTAGAGGGGVHTSYGSNTGGGCSSLTEKTVTATSYTISVGGGSAYVSYGPHPGYFYLGGSTTALGYTATRGGGSGGQSYASRHHGGSGGSGGGSCGGNGGAGTSCQGYNGASGSNTAGGGAASAASGGTAGNGLSVAIKGSSSYYGGGGGTGSATNGRTGYGANGGTNTGQGAGGGRKQGGSGIVIIRYKYQ